ncbi:GTP-dependent dephospho-CoA kinase family protein [Fervidicoccus fontis]|jgi:uncharacterized protein (UPF0218 family)|uniref:GTP-dependent dephospho-CoA kinase n=1 Tax=Fervidicoccus fontis TaxID=683846 RepID=A0A843A8M3_9CREN|nr:DUF359 domain-containing protein [Fervidicoccus fontis]MBE9391045.1 GTP-dependent dephospho-CoA kinase family protein [Fervidicoccus fontis]
MNDKLKKVLSEPFGPIYSGSSFENLIKTTHNKFRYITIGDYVTEKYIEIAEKSPVLSFVDMQTKRERYDISKIKSYYTDIIEIYNKQGTISKETIDEELSEVLINYIQGISSLVIVRGEEDLLSLYVPLLIPMNSSGRVIYGQPGMGAVVFDVNEKTKREISNILQDFYIEFSI